MKKSVLATIKRIMAVILIATLLLDNNVAVMAETIIDAAEKRLEEAEKQQQYDRKIDEVMSQVVPNEEQSEDELVSAEENVSSGGEAEEDFSNGNEEAEIEENDDVSSGEEDARRSDAAEGDEESSEPQSDEYALNGNSISSDDKSLDVSLRLPETILGSSDSKSDPEKIYGELVAEDDYTKTYKKDSTHYVTVINSTKKTFTDENGDEKEYDLSLIPSNPESGNEVELPTADEIRDAGLDIVYSPRETDVKVTLPANVTDETGITVENNGNSIEFFPLEGDYGNATIKDNALLYNSVQEDIDVQYEINENGVKEGIILQSWTGVNEFNYSFYKKGYSAYIDNNRVYVCNKGDDIPLFIISAPRMIDSNGEESSDIDVTLSQIGGSYIVTLTADSDWLSAPERMYPVTVDPTIEVPTDNIIEVTTSTIHGTYHGAGYGYAGYITARMTGVPGAKDIGRSRMYFQINYDFRGLIPSEAKIDSATLNVYQYGNYSNTTAEYVCYRIKDAWDPYSLTWDNSVGLNLEPSGEGCYSPAYKGMHNFDIRETVNNWVQGLQDNNGLVVMATDEAAIGSCFYTPASTGTGGQVDFSWDKRPSITIDWSVPDPVDINYPIDETSVVLRSMILTERSGKLQFEGVFADGTATPGAIVFYSLNDESKEYKGQNYASYSYKYPDSSPFDEVFPKGTTRYKDKLGNWQTLYPFTEPEFNVLYNIKAFSSIYGSNGRENKSDDFVIYKVTQYDTLPKIAAYYGVPLAQIMFDNRVQDMLLVANNTLFIRNPQKNATIPYNPPPLSDSEKAKIDGQLMGRGLHCEFGFEPVNMNTGNFYLNRIDASVPDYIGTFDLERNYNSKGAGYNSMFGRGWSFEYDEQISQDIDGNLYYRRADGSILVFEKKDDTYISPTGYNLTLERKQVSEGKADFGEGEETYPIYEYVIKDTSNSRKTFNYFGLLTRIENEKSGVTLLNYDESMKLASITSPAGTIYGFTVNDEGLITTVSLPNGSVLGYNYDDKGNLVSYTDADSHVIRYEYDDNHRMTAWYDGAGNLVVRNEYDQEGRVVKQTDGNGFVSTLSYENKKTVATDGNGNSTTYVLDDRYRTVAIINPDGTKRTMEYDEDNQLSSETDELGHTTSYKYDSEGNETSRTRFDGAVKTFVYDNAHHITSATGYDGIVTDYEYDSAGNLVAVTIDSILQGSYKYDNYGRMTSLTDANGNTSYFAYTGANLTQITDANGNITSLSYNSMGLVTSIRNAAGGVSSTNYSAEGWTLSETTPEGHTKQYSFDGAGSVVGYVDGNGNSFTFAYDAMGNLIATTDPDGAVYTASYDAVGNKISETDAEGNTTSYVYDSMNRVVSTTYADGKTTTCEYDAAGNMVKFVDKKGNTTSYTYDYAQEAIKTITDAMGQTVSYEFEEGALPVKTEYPDGSVETSEFDNLGRVISQKNAAGRVSTYTYDANGNRLTETVADNITAYKYDCLNQITDITYNDGATIHFDYDSLGHVIKKTDANGGVTEYIYSEEGTLSSAKDALGAVTAYSYDGNANQISVTDAADHTSKIAYNFLDLPTSVTDALGNVTSYEYDKVGNVNAVTNALGGKTSFTYDSLYRQTSVTDPNGNISKVTYDANGNITKAESPDGSSITYEYDALDRTVKVTYSSGLVVEFEYDWRGNVVHNWDNESFDEYYEYNVYDNQTKVTNSLGETSTIEYDDLQRIIKVTAADGSSVSYNYDKAGNIASSTDEEGKETVYSYDKNGNMLSKKDSFDREWIYKYDALGKLQSITSPDGSNTLYRYDLLGNLTSVTNAEGYVESYGYNALSLMVMKTDANGNTTLMDYDALGIVKTATTAEDGVASYAYDANGNQIGYTDAEGNTTAYTYDAVDRVASMTLPNGGTYSYTYDDNDALLTETDPLGNVTKYMNNLHGQAVKQTLPNGAEYSYEYDSLDRIVKIVSPQGLSKAYTYDVSGNFVKDIDQSGRENIYAYDVMGRLLSATNALGYVTKYTYDDIGNLESVSTPLGNTTKYSYDVLDRVTKVVDPAGIEETYSYDKVGNVTEYSVNSKHTTRYTYDGNGNILTVKNPLDEVLTNSYDSMNRLVKKTDAAGNITSYAYDKNSRLTSVQDAAGKVTSYSYDGNGNILSMSYGEGRGTAYTYDLLDRVATATAGGNPVVNTYSYKEDLTGAGSDEGSDNQANSDGDSEEGTSSSGIRYSFEYDSVGNMLSYSDGNGNSNTYTYDLLSNLTSRTNGLGDTESYSYDENNNLAQVTRPNGRTIKYDYNKLDALLTTEYSDENDGVVLYGYDIDGRRLTMEDLTGEAVYEYDEDNRLTGVQQGDGSIIKYSYDEFGNLSELTYPDGKKVIYTYDALDRLVGVTDREGKNTTYSYDSAGNMTEVKRANGTSAFIAYDPSGQVTDVKNLDASGKTISEYKYTYDLSGFVLTEEVSVDEKTETRNYTYDGAGQLTSSLTTDEDGNKVEEAVYAYDEAGNRISAVINKSTIRGAIEKKEITLSYNAANQLTVMKDSDEGTTEYIYDENGNRIRATKAGESVLDYTYDTENRLTAITDKNGLLMTALYDGDDNRVFLASRKEDTKEYKVYIEKEEPAKPGNNNGRSGQNNGKSYERVKSAKTSEMGKLGNLFWYGFAGNMLQAVSTSKETVGKFWVDTWTDLVSAYHRKLLKDRADKDGIIANPRGISGIPGDSDVTYKSEYEGTKTLIPYQTKKDTYYYYEMRNFVNDINQTNAQVLTAYDENGEQKEAYSYGNERLDYNNGSDTYYYDYTGKGSVAQLMTASGSAIASYMADDYGNMTVNGNTETGNPYDYNAERTDSTGYQYLRARYYDPVSGNFLTEDSYAGNIAEPMTLNLYTYAENNPVNYADPSGHGVIGSLIKAATAIVAPELLPVINAGAALFNVGKKIYNDVKYDKGTYKKIKQQVKKYHENTETSSKDVSALKLFHVTSKVLEKTIRLFCTSAKRVGHNDTAFVKNDVLKNSIYDFVISSANKDPNDPNQRKDTVSNIFTFSRAAGQVKLAPYRISEYLYNKNLISPYSHSKVGDKYGKWAPGLSLALQSLETLDETHETIKVFTDSNSNGFDKTAQGIKEVSSLTNLSLSSYAANLAINNGQSLRIVHSRTNQILDMDWGLRYSGTASEKIGKIGTAIALIDITGSTVAAGVKQAGKGMQDGYLDAGDAASIGVYGSLAGLNKVVSVPSLGFVHFDSEAVARDVEEKAASDLYFNKQARVEFEKGNHLGAAAFSVGSTLGIVGDEVLKGVQWLGDKWNGDEVKKREQMMKSVEEDIFRKLNTGGGGFR